MLALSVVAVVHREQAHVGQCVRSVLGHSDERVELVMVDDASPDHAPELLDRLAEREPRLRVLHLPEHAGAEAARARGLEAARGAYVWFVDVADLPQPAGVLEALAEEPDVLVVGHVRENAVGKRRPAPRRSADRFDKVMRREIAGDHWRALLTADRVAVDDEVRYVRRTAPSINRRRRGEEPGFFETYDHALAIGRREADVAAEMVRDGLRELDRHEDRSAFWDGLVERARRHGADVPARGSLRAYDAMRAAREQRRALAARKRKVSAAARKRALDRHYESARKKPIDPDLAVFASYWFRGVSDSPRAIHEKARELVPGMRGVWVVGDDAAVPDGVELVHPGTEAYFDVLARAKFFVNNVNFPNHLVKRRGTLHVMTHHGTPLKRMGLDLRDTQVAGKRMDFDALLRRCARWDFSVSSNPLSTIVWERVYPLPYETLEVGYPRNDALANATPEQVAQIRAELGIDRRAVLYAPTHREYRSGYTPTLDLAALADALGDDHVVLARLHYFYGADPVLRRLHDAGRVRDVGAHPSIEELCLAADVLVTDYSSLMFDYAVLDRPIVIHAPDWEVYLAMRGTYFDLQQEPPGPFTRTEAEVADAIRAGDPEPALRAAFRERYCPWDDGRASERVVRRVWLGEEL